MKHYDRFHPYALAARHLCSFGPEVAAGGMLLGEGIVGAEAAGALAGGGGLFSGITAAGVMPYVSGLGTILQVGQMMSAGEHAKAQGEAAQRMADYEARQLEVKAGQERAFAQRRMLDQRRRTDLAQSRLQALSAAGGGGALDPGILDLAEGIESEGELRALDELYGGEERARGYIGNAGARRTEGSISASAGRARQSGYNLSAASTLLEGAARSYSLYDKYNSGSRARGYG